MKQEPADYFIQQAKDYAKAEKELGNQPWVYITFKKCDNTVIFRYDLPREVYERRQWVVRWRQAKLICRYPKDNVKAYYSFYDRRLGTNRKWNEDLKKLSCAKAQVTKMQRRIDSYIASNAFNLFFDATKDEGLREARKKLAMKLAEVKAAEERLKIKVEQLKKQHQ